MNKNHSKSCFCAKEANIIKCHSHGFTLIELLVVVLIIGILAAVAVPQYNKAVLKARGREVYVAIDAFDKALHTYYLENGTYVGAYSNSLIEIAELKHFKYIIGSAYDDRLDITFSLQTGTGVDVYANWQVGSLWRVTCNNFPSANGANCEMYFDMCPERLQLSSIERTTSYCDLLKGLVRKK